MSVHVCGRPPSNARRPELKRDGNNPEPHSPTELPDPEPGGCRLPLCCACARRRDQTVPAATEPPVREAACEPEPVHACDPANVEAAGHAQVAGAAPPPRPLARLPALSALP